jgi:hypothetical protein
MPSLILNGTRVGRADLLDSGYLLVGPSGILVGGPGDTAVTVAGTNAVGDNGFHRGDESSFTARRW